ncbi:MAG: HEPN domain-containing protein [Candidatus Aenigmarchaeota archaeon]|nr:HEPN domain-containing protein [Candidatus Aenigmarchaeota archaeon]
MEDSETDIERIRKFLEKSESDLVSARILLDKGQFGDSCYFSQQAAEKAVKAYLILKGKFLRIHTPSGKFSESLEQEGKKWRKKLDKAKNSMKFLERYWIEPRYPDISLEQYSEEKANHALKKAKFVFNTLKKFLKEGYDIDFEKKSKNVKDKGE